ncbi:glycosyltransferase family 2 protein [Pseudoalteromonas fuliginea]|uniref:glycosyltransferase family 2 protein n=1 Tax=Pseudoalteromonas fuliginea TaxID=1872678 RepID=UPI003176C654
MSSLISIVTATYNSESYIKSVYESLLMQTYKNWEWLITDDCSTDETSKILHQLTLADNRIKVYFNQKNQGAAVARNISISRAEGDYIAFIDSDDLWHANKLETQLEFMMDNNYDFTFTSYELIDASGDKLGKVVEDYSFSISVDYNGMLKKKATMGCSTVMIRCDAYTDLLMPLLRTGQDYALWLKLLREGGKAYLVPEVLTLYRILPGSISRNKFKKATRQWQVYREIESLSRLKSFQCFLFYAFRAVFRK